ncbi:MAG: Dabb family protein [Cyclobacteriaceae bacterium]
MKETKRRSFVKKSALGFAGWLGLSSFSKSQAGSLGGDFVHTVYFWMKAPEDTPSNTLFTTNLRIFLDAVDVIQSYHIGVPANTPRDVVDNSYSFALIVTFTDKAAHDVYQEHAIHKKFIADTQHLWTKVQIYDSIGVS